ncbi:hypothetical protein [Polyangium sorediatum]|uniref:Uncharacterized protein n=1 Tax=Polyangium sorediatum TaxID=889274 RepID=A0ABT6P7E7_9BACT|nr:hypothetical protein [Polyangium sorediatum]MDI1436493.1 hypothetical protein [Polyangium sorediatum]
MTSLPRHLGQAFLMAAGELGMASAARLFVRELSQIGGEALVGEACDMLGREYPVFDFVAHRWGSGHRDPTLDPILDPAPAARALEGISRLLVIGLETDALDALVTALPGVDIGLVAEPFGVEPDMRRVLANYGDAVRPVSLTEFRRWAGRRSALLTFVYGTNGHTAHVAATWLRVAGPDVRPQFRSLVGWDVLGEPMRLHPRWLVETGRDDFSALVGPPRRSTLSGPEAHPAPL